MKLFLALPLLLGFVCYTRANNCEPITQEDCETLTSEYEKYRECMEHRTKRSASCSGSEEDDFCYNCDCDSCNSCNECNRNDCCNSCCNIKKSASCSSYSCCHKSCRAECRSNSCRSSCKRKCIERQSAYTSSGSSTNNSTVISQIGGSHLKADHNITTIIHLNNIINNTNIIDLPININSTNINNITIESQGSSSTGSSSNCCETISPRQCVQQDKPPYVRCFHIRKNVCGNICSAPYLHYQRHQICDNSAAPQNCRQQIMYIPQPQPRCAYQQQWPYVSCGNQGYHSCEGCYDHYIRKSDVAKCSNFCYDDGFGVGPYYRQGPFYRPGYAHFASCLQTGLCQNFNPLGAGGFGGLGYYPFGDNGIGYGYDGGLAFGGGNYPPWSYYANPEMNVNASDSISEIVVNPMTIPNMKWENVNSGIEAKVGDLHTERYAEIKIRPTETATTQSLADNELTSRNADQTENDE